MATVVVAMTATMIVVAVTTATKSDSVDNDDGGGGDDSGNVNDDDSGSDGVRETKERKYSILCRMCGVLSVRKISAIAENGTEIYVVHLSLSLSIAFLPEPFLRGFDVRLGFSSFQFLPIEAAVSMCHSLLTFASKFYTLGFKCHIAGKKNGCTIQTSI
ncbi:hypothetical protein E2542_SST11870 [Spatholobus suberectus]|nr:hypothetical protein E2542_SST11870 [Spatholobus suberectus]